MFRYLKFVIHSDFSLNNVEYVLGRLIDKCLLSTGRKNPEQEVTFIEEMSILLCEICK